MLRLSSHLLSALVVSSALLACGDDEQTFVPPAGDAGSAGTSAGASGSSGQAGASAGSAGTAGKSGASGSSGQSGSAGTSAGASGASGQGGAGAGGAAGDAGAAGESGAAGTTGGAGGTDAGGAGQGGAAGATGGSAGTGGSGGSGGAPAQLACLPASDHASVLTLEASSPFCAVRVHKTSLASLGFSTQITWGTHGGPLSTDTTTGAVVRRWAPGTDVHAALDATPTKVTVPNLPASPAKVYFGPAVDVPGVGLTTLSYTTDNATSSGEIIALDTALTTVKSRAAVNGFYSGVALPSPIDGLTKPRMLFTALSPVTVAATTTSAGGVYTLDLCDSTTLIKDGCGSSTKKGTWAGGASGPVAVDSDGNTFAALSTFGGLQEVHGFTSADAASSTASVGQTVLTNTDFSTSIAASAPTADSQGLVVVQTSDASTFSAKPALVYRYGVSGTTLTSTAVASGGFQAAKANAAQIVFGADDGTIWVAVDGTDAAYFVALQRK